ncbi:MAG: hypothetical protein ACRBCI_03930 [Cellvibrionaceae bacterium]
MPEAFYQVISDGSIRPGFSQQEVEKNLSCKLHLPNDVIQSIFSDAKVILERDLEFAEACKYEQSLFLNGLVVRSESMAASS